MKCLIPACLQPRHNILQYPRHLRLGGIGCGDDIGDIDRSRIDRNREYCESCQSTEKLFGILSKVLFGTEKQERHAEQS
jgi:hypothetical protein